EQQILASKYNVKVAYLEWKRLVEGEGPLELEKLKSAMRKAKQEYEEKSGYVDDIAKLDKQGLVNAVEINQTKNNVEESRQLYLSSRLQLESYQKHVLPTLIEKARAGLRKNRIELEQTRKSSGFKIGEAAANLKQAEEDLRNVQIQLEQARQELEKTEIKSPVSGLVVLYEDYRGGSKRPPRIGDTVWQNQPILFLPDLSAMKVKTRVHESELHLIAKGEKAIICVDAYPDLLLEGEVDSIGILAEHNPHWSAGDKYFQVMLHLVKTDSRLRPGMTTQAQIVAASAKNILTVPVQTIYSANGNKYCHVKDGRHWVRREILTGLQNEDFVEIVSGLKEGDSVSALPLEEL
ncbi:MAG: efflux RND transporter periplasmic adaptor subunit, partial [Candidatus Aureabacteria bacterium]|nr:efflux RND transporter periplasmic adaptor subunit [Candidatus Auribacterota bacterium]